MHRLKVMAEKKIKIPRLFKYLIVVIIGLIADYGVYSINYYVFKLGIVGSNLIAFAIGALLNMILIRIYIFSNPRFTFIVDYLLTLLSNGIVVLGGTMLMVIMVNHLSMNHYVAKSISMIITFILNYIIRKHVFSRNRGLEEEELFEKEETFHDDWAETINLDEVMVLESFEASTCPENRTILEKLGDLKDKKILELGCGAGEASIYFSLKGADVTATDISSGMLDVVQKLASRFSVTLKTQQAYSNHLPFAENSFDICYAANLLHHVDIEETLLEAKRVLKKGGLFVSWDPLAHNPLINIYRKEAMNVRTEDEHPLKMKDLKTFKKHYSKVHTFYSWLFTLWIFIRFYLIEKVDPNKERYWKKIIKEHKRLDKTYSRLLKYDKFFLKLFPFLKRYCWNITIIAQK